VQVRTAVVVGVEDVVIADSLDEEIEVDEKVVVDGEDVEGGLDVAGGIGVTTTTVVEVNTQPTPWQA
jgi:pyruvate/2-oxoglutarate/acetoin dehydrogenase E1 component